MASFLVDADESPILRLLSLKVAYYHIQVQQRISWDIQWGIHPFNAKNSSPQNGNNSSIWKRLKGIR